ncbi:hypothetical protein Tco_1561556 [Tanacetum coccineum]
MSSTLDQNTSTYVTISSESKWKIEWLNSTSWKRIINLQTFSQKHYQENVTNGDGRTVQLKFSSQSTTTALSIENGSLFEGESECENLLHHTRSRDSNTLSSAKSPLKVDKDWKEKFFCPANHVREEEPKKARENNDAPIIEDWVSDDEDELSLFLKVEKKTIIPTAT